MEKRFQEMSSGQLVSALENITGKKMEGTQRNILIHGAEEKDLVYSGLEETMITAYHEIREIKNQNKKIEDLRTAAFVSSINKVGASYTSLGLFP
jgi:glutamate dehydrogenase (NAD(P)+)